MRFGEHMASFSYSNKNKEGLMHIVDDPFQSPIKSVKQLVSEMAPKSTQETHQIYNKTSIKNMWNSRTKNEAWCESIHSSNLKETTTKSPLPLEGAQLQNKFSIRDKLPKDNLFSVDGVQKQLTDHPAKSCK